MTQTQEKLGSHEVLRVTSDGQFIWHPEADVMLEEGDFSHAPAMPHILKALRKQRTWVGLTDEERSKIWGELPSTKNEERDACIFAECIELYLKEKNI